jgi:hypothetical protein
MKQSIMVRRETCLGSRPCNALPKGTPSQKLRKLLAATCPGDSLNREVRGSRPLVYSGKPLLDFILNLSYDLTKTKRENYDST